MIAANVAGTRFGSEWFIRNAIGWALREYAKTDPARVDATMHDLGEKLSPLSRREALSDARRELTRPFGVSGVTQQEATPGVGQPALVAVG